MVVEDQNITHISHNAPDLVWCKVTWRLKTERTEERKSEGQEWLTSSSPRDWPADHQLIVCRTFRDEPGNEQQRGCRGCCSRRVGQDRFNVHPPSRRLTAADVFRSGVLPTDGVPVVHVVWLSTLLESFMLNLTCHMTPQHSRLMWCDQSVITVCWSKNNKSKRNK